MTDNAQQEDPYEINNSEVAKRVVALNDTLQNAANQTGENVTVVFFKEMVKTIIIQEHEIEVLKKKVQTLDKNVAGHERQIGNLDVTKAFR